MIHPDIGGEKNFFIDEAVKIFKTQKELELVINRGVSTKYKGRTFSIAHHEDFPPINYRFRDEALFEIEPAILKSSCPYYFLNGDEKYYIQQQVFDQFYQIVKKRYSDLSYSYEYAFVDSTTDIELLRIQQEERSRRDYQAYYSARSSIQIKTVSVKFSVPI